MYLTGWPTDGTVSAAGYELKTELTCGAIKAAAAARRKSELKRKKDPKSMNEEGKIKKRLRAED
jgi:hypothetical protein